jgi:oligopeptide transport system substrate-binding protein
MVSKQLFAGLVKLTAEGEILPELARRWQVLEGGKLYLFHLRQDGYWSDGQPVTAQDFVVSWRRNLSPSMPPSPASLLFDIKGARAYYEGLLTDPEQIGVSASDDYTLVVELEAPVGYFLQILDLPQLMPIPAHKIKELGDEWTKPDYIVSNGPLRLKQKQSAQRMDFVPNSGYHGSTTGNVAGASLIIADPVETKNLYDSGQLDAVPVMQSGFTPDDVSSITRRWPDEVVSSPAANTMYYWFDVRQKPFDDRRVRRAFSLATDQKILAAKTSAFMFSAATGGLVPPGIPGHVPDLALPYDPEKARALLAEAGFLDGQGFPTSIIVSTGDGVPRYLASELQRQWQKNLGLWIEFEVEELGYFAQRLEQDPPGLWLLGWLADYPDPDNYLRVGSWRQTGYWTHPDYERLIEEARRLTDQGQRMELYRHAEQILAEEAPVVPLVYPSNFLLVKPWVKHLPMSYVGPDMARAIVADPPAE